MTLFQELNARKVIGVLEGEIGALCSIRGVHTHSNSPALRPTPCSSRSLSKLTITHNRLTHYASFGALHHLPTHVLQLHSLGSESLRFYF